MRVLFLIGVLVALLVASLFEFSDAQLLSIGEWLIYASLPAANGFVLVYGLTRPWWLSQIGRALLTKAVAVAALFDMSAYQQAFDVVLPLWFTVLVVALLFVGVNYQFLVMLVTRRDKDFRRLNEGEQKNED